MESVVEIIHLLEGMTLENMLFILKKISQFIESNEEAIKCYGYGEDFYVCMLTEELYISVFEGVRLSADIMIGDKMIRFIFDIDSRMNKIGYIFNNHFHERLIMKKDHKLRYINVDTHYAIEYENPNVDWLFCKQSKSARKI